jgi:hypothetical protein
MDVSPALAEFVSASTAGVVCVEIGFVPDFAMLISDHGGVPKVFYWLNNAKFANFPANRTVSLQGASTAFAPDNTGLMTVYNGAETIAADETANSTPKHVDAAGTPATAGRLTRRGLQIAAAAQVNSGRNILVAWRGQF